MTNPSSLERFIAGVQAAWGPLTSELVETCRRLVIELAGAPVEPWLAAVIQADATDAELYRDPERGFVLLTHVEQQGTYRPPHDHGAGWVIYTPQHGEAEMRTYARVAAPDGARLVRRDRDAVRVGDAGVYLPGDIHDTRCVSRSVRMFRFTSCDLKLEDRAGRMTRYGAV